MARCIVYGAGGWIGGMVSDLLEADGDRVAEVRPGTVRLSPEHFDALAKEVQGATHVFCCVGRTHGCLEDGTYVGTIDYLEHPGKLPENLRDNLQAPLLLAAACRASSTHLTYLGTGCIFDASSAAESFAEDDDPNYSGSSYSAVKGVTDVLMRRLLADAALNVRIRMPISSRAGPRDFITKITRYAKICSQANSMTVLDELLPVMIDMALASKTGTVNLVNPGTVSHDEILAMYRDIVDPAFTWSNFTYEEQRRVLKSHRSNNQLCTAVLEAWLLLSPGKEGLCVRPIRDAVRHALLARKEGGGGGVVSSRRCLPPLLLRSLSSDN